MYVLYILVLVYGFVFSLKRALPRAIECQKWSLYEWDIMSQIELFETKKTGKW